MPRWLWESELAPRSFPHRRFTVPRFANGATTPITPMIAPRTVITGPTGSMAASLSALAPGSIAAGTVAAGVTDMAAAGATPMAAVVTDTLDAGTMAAVRVATLAAGVGSLAADVDMLAAALADLAEVGTAASPAADMPVDSAAGTLAEVVDTEAVDGANPGV